MQLKAYLWPFEQYRDAEVGTILERAAAFRHNRRLARSLPRYVNRWLMISCLLLTATVIAPPVLSALTGIAFTLAFCMTVHLLHVFLRFRYS
jgi:preprotein translocase subunit SecY